MNTAISKIYGMFPLPANPSCSDIQNAITKINNTWTTKDSKSADANWKGAYQVILNDYTLRQASICGGGSVTSTAATDSVLSGAVVPQSSSTPVVGAAPITEGVQLGPTTPLPVLGTQPLTTPTTVTGFLQNIPKWVLYASGGLLVVIVIAVMMKGKAKPKAV